MSDEKPELTPLQRAIATAFFAVQDHGHFSTESQAAGSWDDRIVKRGAAIVRKMNLEDRAAGR